MATPKTGWTTCPICNTRLKSEKLDGHLKNVHPKGVKTREEREKIVGRRRSVSGVTKWLALGAVIVVIVIIASYGYAHMDLRGSNKGDKPYNFVLDTTDGPKYSLDDHLGDKPILMGFMSTECPHCANMADIFEHIYVNYSDDVEIIILISNEDATISAARNWANQHNLQLTVLYDKGGSTFTKYTSDIAQPFYPTLYIINRSGKIDWSNKKSSQGEYTYQEMTTKLDKVLS